MQVYIDDEEAQKVVVEQLTKDIEGFKKTLKINDESERGSGTFSWDYDEDCEEIHKLIKSIEATLSWYN